MTKLFALILCIPLTAGTLKGTISISGAWALYPMTIAWADAFKKAHPDVTIDISAGGAGKGIADALAGITDIGMVSRDISPDETARGAFAIAVVKDAVVPTISEKNPALGTLMKKGLSREKAIAIWIHGTIATWGQAVSTNEKTPLRVYTRSDACGAAETWARYLGKNQEDLGGTGVYGDPGLAEALRNDPLGIGFNNVNFAYDPNTKQPVAGLRVVPLDLNADGALAPNELFYATRDALIRAIAAGIYPSPPARSLYFVTKGKPAVTSLTAAFIRFALSEGQAMVEEAGYVTLSKETLENERIRVGR